MNSNDDWDKGIHKQSYLVQFTYEDYCQGTEDVTISVLVHNVKSFAHARAKIGEKYPNPRNFVNLTIDDY